MQLLFSRIKLEQQTPCPTSTTQTSLVGKPTFPNKIHHKFTKKQDSLTKFSIDSPLCFLILWPTSLHHQPISFSRGNPMRFRSPVSWTHIPEINGSERPLGNVCTLNNPDIGGAIRVAMDGVFSYKMRNVLEPQNPQNQRIVDVGWKGQQKKMNWTEVNDFLRANRATNRTMVNLFLTILFYPMTWDVTPISSEFLLVSLLLHLFQDHLSMFNIWVSTPFVITDLSNLCFPLQIPRALSYLHASCPYPGCHFIIRILGSSIQPWTSHRLLHVVFVS